MIRPHHIKALSMIYGNTIRLYKSGLGYQAVTSGNSRVYTELGAYPIHQTFPGQGLRLYPGLIPVATSGSLGDRALITAISVTFGDITDKNARHIA
jgi:hypothetical protein